MKMTLSKIVALITAVCSFAIELVRIIKSDDKDAQ